MRICVISDVHSNLPALEAVLRAAAPYDQLWHLGDVVGYGPQPNEVVARLADEQALGVRGNHDAAAIGTLATEAFNDDARAAVEWTNGRLDDAARAWLAKLPERVEMADFTLAHGSPRDPTWEYVFSSGVARGNMNAFRTPYCLVGHTHVPLAFVLCQDRLQAVHPDGTPLDIADQRALLNPGSVGQPRDGDPRASVLLLDTETSSATWQRVEYDVALVQRLITEAGLPSRLGQRLQLGL